MYTSVGFKGSGPHPSSLSLLPFLTSLWRLDLQLVTTSKVHFYLALTVTDQDRLIVAFPVMWWTPSTTVSVLDLHLHLRVMFGDET